LLILVCVAPAHAAYPGYWIREAHCIHYRETRSSWNTGWATHYVYGTRIESEDRGGLQIAVKTWAAHAPAKWTRDPAAATRAQQLFVAWRIWWANGRRWGGNQWPNSSRACGVL
jgi:hypothetical protein